MFKFVKFFSEDTVVQRFEESTPQVVLKDNRRNTRTSVQRPKKNCTSKKIEGLEGLFFGQVIYIILEFNHIYSYNVG